MLRPRTPTLRSPRAPTAALILGFLITTGAPGLLALEVDGVGVEILGAQASSCKTFEPFEDEAALDGCFLGPANVPPELLLTSEDASLLASVTLEILRLGDPSHKSSSRDFKGEGRTEYRKLLPLPGIPSGKMASPDAPLVQGGDSPFESLLNKSGSTRSVRPGRYRLEVVAGEGGGAVTIRLGLEVKAPAGAEELSRWPVAGGDAHILVSGCVEHHPDPVVELSLTDCDDPRFRIKAVAPERREGLSLTDYVDNSLLFYDNIWRLKDRRDHLQEEPRFIQLELIQQLAGERHYLVKVFVELGNRVLVATFYAPPDEKRELRRRYGELDRWLTLR